MAAETTNAAGKGRSDSKVAAALVGVFCLMLGASYAAVPLYKFVCAATGINGTTQRVAGNAGGQVLDRMVTVHFDANTGGGMAWEFKPVAEHVTVHIGETTMAYFTAYNPADRTISGSATFNVTPEITGRYFDKIQCFCFNQQTLGPHERAELPVTFYVDPAIVGEHGADNVRDITLSYTFFETQAPAAPTAAATGKVKGS